MTDAWGEEPGPNPVLQIIGVRAAQAGVPAAAALGALSAVLPPTAVLPAAVAGGVLVGGGLSAYFVTTFHARSSFGFPLLTRLEDATDSVALTFDDGPHPDTTPRLLDLLAEHDARATFFLVGERAAKFPALARRIAEAGHAVGVHGLRHRALVLMPPAQVKRELETARERIEEASGRGLGEQPWLRPPHGFKTWLLCRTVTRLGWRLAAWSVDPRDYDRTLTPAELARRLSVGLTPGEIALLHERPGMPPVLFEALPAVLSSLKARRLRAVPLSPG